MLLMVFNVDYCSDLLVRRKETERFAGSLYSFLIYVLDRFKEPCWNY